MYHIQKLTVKNYKSLKNNIIDFWPNKTVFVGKNDVGKSNILKAIRVVFWYKLIKNTDFNNPWEKIEIILELNLNNNVYEIIVQARLENNKVLSEIIIPKEIKQDYKKIELIYIPSDRKYQRYDSKSWFYKLINLILKNKENSNLEKKYFDKIHSLWQIDKLSASKNTTLLITLLELYLHTIKYAKNEWFKLFILDQPENFLHPHATKLIDNLLWEISELQNTQILYSTHSPDLVSNFKKEIYEISDIVFVKKENELTITKKIENKNGRYDKIMINLIFKNSSLFFSDSVILVEWETEKVAVPNIFENWEWSENKKSRYNLESKNINVIDVGWKWALSDWYEFCCDLFWHENVFAMIDRDPDYIHDEVMIVKTIKKVYGIKHVDTKNFMKYNWIVLEWEFESYYDQTKIKQYLESVIIERSKRFWDKVDQNKINENLNLLEIRMVKLNQTHKISKAYSKLFWKYFKRSGKPTIAFNLSTYLSKNNWYTWWIINKFQYIANKLEK